MKTFVADEMGRVGTVQIARGKVLVDRFTKVAPRTLTGDAGSISWLEPTDCRRTKEPREQNIEAQIARMVQSIFGDAVKVSPKRAGGMRSIVATDGTP